MRVTQLCFACLSLVVLLSPAQAVLTITIAPDGSGNARMLVVGSGSTTSTTRGNWKTNGSGQFSGGITTNPFNNFFSGAAGTTSDYTDQDFEIDGFRVMAGIRTRTFDRFTFDDDGSARDDFSMGFGDGTNFTTLDTNGASVGVISVFETAWQTIRFRGTSTFSNPAGEALVFTDNFNVGTYTFSDSDNFFWGGSRTNGITLEIISDVIPEPSSALLLLLPATALLKRKRFC